MSSEVKGPGTQDLQFDRMATEAPAAGDAERPTAVCGSCQATIPTVYYQINGVTVCDDCRRTVESAAGTPKGLAPFLMAALFGGGAGLVGAAIYYGVIALANLEIGIVAILIGYMVGYSVRKGAGGSGGRRFQFLAVALTYGSVALAYTPIAIQGAMEGRREQAKTAVAVTKGNAASDTADHASTDAADANAVDAQAVTAADLDVAAAETEADGGGFLVAIVSLIGLVAVLPIMVVFGSLPSGLISAAIIFFGMQKAWAMTGSPTLVVQGPFRVGAEHTSGAA
jgi:hypothetical protein